MVGYCSRAPFAVLLFAISVLVYVPTYVSAGTESQILACEKRAASAAFNAGRAAAATMNAIRAAAATMNAGQVAVMAKNAGRAAVVERLAVAMMRGRQAAREEEREVFPGRGTPIIISIVKT